LQPLQSRLAARSVAELREAERIANARAGRERYEEERRQYYESLGDPARSADAAPQPNVPETVFDQVVEVAPQLIVATFVPGYGELLDLSVMFGRGYSWTDRGLATASFLGGVISGGWSPNIGPAIRARRGLTTPSKYFGNKTAQEVSEAMTKKFGPPKSVREGAETFYNPKTQRSFNVHTDPAHGPPHVDIRRRGGYPERKYSLAEGQQ